MTSQIHLIKRSQELLIKKISALPLIPEILYVSEELGSVVFLVGGTLRDFLLPGVPAVDRLDIDLVIESDTRRFGNRLAERSGGSFFMMDKSRGIGRVFIKRSGTLPMTVDLSPLREGSIVNDLKLRDFTINSIAVDLALMKSGSRENFVIDPCNGVKDISKKIIRKNSEKIFDDDPLRLIRAIRLETSFSLTMEKETETLIKEKKTGISTVSGERIREEILAALKREKNALFFQRLKNTGVLESLFPLAVEMERIESRDSTNICLWDRSIRLLRTGESLLNRERNYFEEFQIDIENFLGGKIEGGISLTDLLFFVIVVFVIVLYEAGTNDEGEASAETCKVCSVKKNSVNKAVRTICGRLKLGRRASNTLNDISRFKGLYRRFVRARKTNDRALMFSFFRKTGESGVTLALLSIFEGRSRDTENISNEPERIAKALIRYYYTEFVNLRPLVSGKDLKVTSGLKPGPLFRKVLDRVDMLNATGILKNREEALRYIETLILNKAL